MMCWREKSTRQFEAKKKKKMRNNIKVIKQKKPNESIFTIINICIKGEKQVRIALHGSLNDF